MLMNFNIKWLIILKRIEKINDDDMKNEVH